MITLLDSHGDYMVLTADVSSSNICDMDQEKCDDARSSQR
jgi:hypothetical protein